MRQLTDFTHARGGVKVDINVVEPHLNRVSDRYLHTSSNTNASPCELYAIYREHIY